MSTLKDIYDIIKDLKSLAKKHNDDEMAEKVVEIQEGFFDIREELENVKEENKRLKDEIVQLEDISELEKDLELTIGGYIIRVSEKNAGKDIRYCAACWQNHKKLMPFVHTIGHALQCSNCHTVVR